MPSTRRTSHRRWGVGIGIAGLLAGLALACGDEKQPAPDAPAPAAAPAKPAAPAGTPDADTLARLEALYEWDPSAGAARDLADDTAACMSQVTSQGLQGVAEHIVCMRSRGWKTLQPQS